MNNITFLIVSFLVVSFTTKSYAAQSEDRIEIFSSEAHCLSDADCGYKEFCDTSPHCPENNIKGVCQQKPNECIKVILPVLECNGQTYNNACEAAQAGLSNRGRVTDQNR